MGIIAWIILGGIAGWIASMMAGTNASMGVFANIIVGIIGAILGGWIAGFFGADGVSGFNLYSLFIAVVGAFVLLAIVKMFRGSSAR